MAFVVLKFGGSVITPDNPVYVKSAAALIHKVSKTQQVGVVVGGGKTAALYVEAGRHLGVNQFRLDDLAIGVTRLNAALLANAVSTAVPAVPHSIEDAVGLLNVGVPVVVMGGTVPGHTTNTVAALLAEEEARQ